MGQERKVLLCLIAGLALSHAALAQGWVPQRHVELVVPSSAGGNLDSFARPVQRLWHELQLLPVSSAVINRGGGEHAVAYNYIRQRSGDPHYLGIATPVLLTSHITGRISFNYTDVTPIAFLMSEPYIFVVRADLPIKTGKELIDALKTRPDSLSIGLGNVNNRIAIGFVFQQANVDMKRAKMVSFTGTAGQATAVAGGHVDMAVTAPAQALPHIRGGALRVIAVSSPKRMAGELAAAPTWEELGYKEGTYQTWRGMIAPRDITPGQVAYWEDVLQRVTESQEFRKIAEKQQWELSFKGSAEMRKLLEAEYEQTKRVMTYLGLVK